MHSIGATMQVFVTLKEKKFKLLLIAADVLLIFGICRDNKVVKRQQKYACS